MTAIGAIGTETSGSSKTSSFMSDLQKKKKEEQQHNNVAYMNIGNMLNGSMGGQSTQTAQTAFNA